MLIFGEFDVFRPVEGEITLFPKPFALWYPTVSFLLEPHTFEKVVELGMKSSFVVFHKERFVFG